MDNRIILFSLVFFVSLWEKTSCDMLREKIRVLSVVMGNPSVRKSVLFAALSCGGKSLMRRLGVSEAAIHPTMKF